jgi:Peptidase family M28
MRFVFLRRRLRCILCASVASAVFGSHLIAQSEAAIARAAETITTQDVLRRIDVFAADSMMGRDTPSRGLELAAQHVAAEFQRAGLRPAGDGASFLQRFGVTSWAVDTTQSLVAFSFGRSRATARLGRDARYVFGSIPNTPIRAKVVLLTPSPSSESVAGEFKDRIVLVVVDFSTTPAPALNRRIMALASSGAKAVLILSNRDSVTFADRLRTSAQSRLIRDSAPAVDEGAPVLEVHERALRPLLQAAGIAADSLRTARQESRRAIDGLEIEVRLSRRILTRAQVPNVVGILEGSDSALRHEYVVYSAHIDHIGITPGQPDSINNGADDNASGAAGLLELLEAFTQPGARPRRSLVFFAPSGEEAGLLGSAHYTAYPTVPLDRVVANLNMDLIGRNWSDSVIVVGLEQSDLGQTLHRVVQAHPELRMTPISDRWPEERIFYRSDHYNFARKGVPILFFTSGTHADYHRPTDETSTIDGEKEARLLRLIFLAGAAVANAESRPRWVAEHYNQVVGRR